MPALVATPPPLLTAKAAARIPAHPKTSPLSFETAPTLFALCGFAAGVLGSRWGWTPPVLLLAALLAESFMADGHAQQSPLRVARRTVPVLSEVPQDAVR